MEPPKPPDRCFWCGKDYYRHLAAPALADPSPDFSCRGLRSAFLSKEDALQHPERVKQLLNACDGE